MRSYLIMPHKNWWKLRLWHLRGVAVEVRPLMAGQRPVLLWPIDNGIGPRHPPVFPEPAQRRGTTVSKKRHPKDYRPEPACCPVCGKHPEIPAVCTGMRHIWTMYCEKCQVRFTIWTIQ